MTVGRRHMRTLRCIVLCIAAGGLLGACNREMRGTLRDLGIHVDEPATEVTPAPAAAPAPAAPAPSTAAVPAAAAPAPSTPSAAATPVAAIVTPPAPMIAPAPIATAAPAAPVKPPVPLGDLHSGWIAGTIGEVPQPMISIKSYGSPYGTVQIAFHSKTGTTHGTIDFTTAWLKPTILSVENEREKSSVFALNLPVGDYLIDSLRFTGSDDLYNRNCKVENKLAVPFTVIPGKVNYLGALLTSADWGATRHGPMAPLCGYFIVSDQSARDEENLRQRFPNLAGPIEVHLLAGNTPEAEKFFRSK